MKNNFTRFVTILFFCICANHINITAQDYTSYGAKGGFVAAFQKWNGGTRSPLLEPLANGSIFTEISAGGRSQIILAAGYHTRGSAIVQRAGSYYDQRGIQINYPEAVFKQKFQAVSFEPALKQLYQLDNDFGGYYMLGIRGEYTVSYQLPFPSQYGDLSIEGLNRFNYGISVGGGIEKRLGTLPFMVMLEAQIQPDFSKQIFAPAFSYYDIYSRSYQNFPEQSVINTNLEITLGIKYIIPDEDED